MFNSKKIFLILIINLTFAKLINSFGFINPQHYSFIEISNKGLRLALVEGTPLKNLRLKNLSTRELHFHVFTEIKFLNKLDLVEEIKILPSNTSLLLSLNGCCCVECYEQDDWFVEVMVI